MGKILDLSSMFEESAIDYKLKCIQKELLDEHLSQNKLHHLADELHLIYGYINDELAKQVRVSDLAYERIVRQREEIGSLLNTCYHKWLDKKIDMITEDAQMIALNNEPSSHRKTSRKINSLNKRLNSVCEQNALSLENRYMVQVARDFLDSIDKDSKPAEETTFKKAKTIRVDYYNSDSFVDSIDIYETCLSLYETAGDLFHHRFNEAFYGFYSLSPSTQEEVTKLLKGRGASIQEIKTIEDFNMWQKNLFIVIQTLLGIANKMMIGAEEYIYPDKQEITAIFNDPFFNPHEEARI